MIEITAASFQFLAELLLAVLFCMYPLEKRKHYFLRIVIGVACCLAVGYMMKPVAIAGVIILFILQFSFAVVFVWFCNEVTFAEALYCAACAYASQHFAMSCYEICKEVLDLGEYPVLVYFALYAVSHLGTCIFSYYFVFRKLVQNGHYNRNLRQAIKTVAMILPFVLVLSVFVSVYAQGHYEDLIMFRIYSMLCCYFVLWIQVDQGREIRYQAEIATQKQLLEKQRQQYQFSKENINLINQKCHDMKYQLALIKNGGISSKDRKSLEQLENMIGIYDSAVKTGNDVLDLVLMEKSLLCEKYHIMWTCMADGKKLDFMDNIDLYSMLGNILDNAIESARINQNVEKRIIAVNVFDKGNMLFLQVENYFSHQLLHNSDGSLVTTKEGKEYHGYGLKSVEYIVKKYGGTVSVSQEDDIFIVCIMIPVISCRI